MLDWKKNEYKKNFLSIVLLGIVLRVLLLLFLGTDGQSDWEYGIIAENIVDGKGYSFYYFEDGKLTHEINENSNPAPSAYMAPGYVYLLVAIKLVSNNYLENYIAFGFNLLFYIATMFYLFRITESLYKGKVALIAILIYSLIPEFIYTSYSLGTTQIYHLFLTLIIFYSLKSTRRSKFTLPIILGIAILFRFELFLLLMMIVILMLIRKNYAQVLLLIVIPILFLAPWAIRNQQTFNEFIPFSTTGGLNLYRGSNEIMIGGWHNFNTLEKLSNFNGDTSRIELFLNDMYKEEVVSYITSDNTVASINFVKKFFYYWFVNPNEEKAMNNMYIVPWFIFLSLSIVGIIRKKRIPTIMVMIIVYHTVLAIVFIPLLRYQNMMKVVLIPIAAFGLIELFKKEK